MARTKSPGSRRSRRKALSDRMPLNDWMQIEEALVDPDLKEVWISRQLYREFQQDDVLERMRGFKMMPHEVPGCVMILRYDRDHANVQILTLDDAGAGFAYAVMRNPAMLFGASPSDAHQA